MKLEILLCGYMVNGFPKSYNIGKQIEAKVLFDDASGRSQKYLKGEKVNKSMWTHHWSYENGKERNDYSKLSTEKVIDVEYQTELGKKWQGWGTQLKPSFEPIILARKPVDGTIVNNCMKYDVGGLNIDECRVKTENMKAEAEGRFPANTILTYDETNEEEVCSGFPESKGASSQNNFSNGSIYRGQSLNTSNTKLEGFREWYNDEGSAARYFYCAKVSKKDRNDGLEDIKNTHPTVKPTNLMQYLIRLVTPKGATILDPFCGSGSTGKAAAYENNENGKEYKFIGIESSEEYCKIAKARIENALNDK